MAESLGVAPVDIYGCVSRGGSSGYIWLSL